MMTRMISPLLPGQARFRPQLLTLVVAGLVVFGSGDAGAVKFVYGSVFSGDQVTVPTGSPALGGGQVVIDTDANTLTYHFTIVGLAGAETACHIHGPADPGMNGGVLNALPLGNPKAGVWSYAEAQEADILAGKTYVNIHSSIFPGGEVRGQIVRFNASLDGTQEVPLVTTGGRGWGVFQIDTAANELHYYIAVTGLMGVETAAHIHGQALHGTNAGAAFALPLGSPKVGTWVYAEAAEEGLLKGQYYVNVHSSMFPSGEVRGQIVPTVVPIDGQQEVPPNPSPGAGIGLLSIDTAGANLSFDVRFAGLGGSETAAHIHGFAPPGANAGALQALALGNRKLGVWNYGAVNTTQVLDGLSYFNIHTSAVPGGEIRGQIRGLPGAVTSGLDPERIIAGSLALARMVPNPLHGQGSIQFRLEQPATVQVEFYDSQGRLIRDLGEQRFSAGQQVVAWDGRDGDGRRVESGVYHYVLRTPDGQVSRPLTMIR